MIEACCHRCGYHHPKGTPCGPSQPETTFDALKSTPSAFAPPSPERLKRLQEDAVPSAATEHFLAVDEVLPTVKLQNPCEIEIHLSTERITLRIDGRDHGWNRKTGEHTDSGLLGAEHEPE